MSPTTPTTYTGARILITGASGGIGGALARNLAASGAELILNGRHLPRLEALYDSIVAAGGVEPVLMPLDLERATVDDFSNVAVEIGKLGVGLRGLVHCAALLGTVTPLPRYQPTLWARVHQVNLHAPFLLTQALLPALLAGPRGTVIFAVDRCVEQGQAYWGAYGVTKAALGALAETLAADLMTYPGFQSYALDPGPRPSRLRNQAFPGQDPTALGSLEAAAAGFRCLLDSPERLPVRQTLAADGKLQPAAAFSCTAEALSMSPGH